MCSRVRPPRSTRRVRRRRRSVIFDMHRSCARAYHGRMHHRKQHTPFAHAPCDRDRLSSFATLSAHSRSMYARVIACLVMPISLFYQRCRGTGTGGGSASRARTGAAHRRTDAAAVCGIGAGTGAAHRRATAADTCALSAGTGPCGCQSATRVSTAENAHAHSGNAHAREASTLRHVVVSH
jgi:hypothetical protein